jgi:glycosyltransferase involved in cell wall biosynthesis
MRIPVVAAERNAPHRLDHTSHGRNRLFILNSLRLASHITVQCGSYREKYPEAVQKKLTVIPNPVFPSKDSSNPGETKGAKNLLSVGRLGYQKNMSALIRAFILIEKDFPDWNLLIAGEGEERANLEFLIKAKKLQDRISLPGAVSNVHELYCNSHLFCLPSLWEGFPNAIAEAMARGLPCVGFEECAGTSDLIEHKKTGLLARGNDDPESLAVELKKAMCSPDLRKKLGKNARKSISEYEPEKIFDEWEALIKEVAKE